MKRSNKPLPEIDIISYGVYTRREGETKALPKLLSLTQQIEATPDLEFGIIVEIKKARGRYLDFSIDHPPFKNEEGDIVPSFTGTFRVKYNPFRFFLGETILDPIEDKCGEWKISIFLKEKLLTSKNLFLI